MCQNVQFRNVSVKSQQFNSYAKNAYRKHLRKDKNKKDQISISNLYSSYKNSLEELKKAIKESQINCNNILQKQEKIR